MYLEIKKYIKENYPDYHIWIRDDDSNLISIQKIFHNDCLIPVRLLQNLIFICKISYESISIRVEKATIPNNQNSLILNITFSLK